METAHQAAPQSPDGTTVTHPVPESPKAQHIREACTDSDISTLLDLAISDGGFLHDHLRKLAWPILLGCTSTLSQLQEQASQNEADWKSLPAHKDEDQVRLDVDRSFVYYPDDASASLTHLKQQLLTLILSVLRNHPCLSYFQGYHDIAQVLLLVLGPYASRPALARLSLLRIRDYMLPTLAGAVAHLHLLPAILRAADPPLAAYLPPSPFWAISATLTLYAHDVRSYSHIARLFDFLLAAPAVAPLYIFAALVRARRDDLLEIDPGDHDILHVTLTRFPAQDINFDGLVTDACALHTQYPPASLGRPWRAISHRSVLRTVPNVEAVRRQALADGETWLAEQSRQATRQARRAAMYNALRQSMWRWRRPAAIGVTMAVALLALYMGRGDEWASRRIVLGVAFRGIWRRLGGVIGD